MKRRTFLTSALLGTGAAVLPAAKASSAETIATKAPLTAEVTEGPYYLKLDLVRADITEGLAGVPMDVVFTVVDTEGKSYPGALIDIWHCNPDGHYSGFERGATQVKSKTFLRGTQPVGPDGSVTFHSVYPGWYEGRTTHIHFKVRRGDLTNLTSQFFLPDTLNEFLYTQITAYRREALRDTLNSTDGIAIQAGPTVEGNVRESEGRYIASLTVRVDPTVNRSIDRPHGRGPMDGHAVGHMPPPMDGQHGDGGPEGRGHTGDGPMGPPPGMAGDFPPPPDGTDLLGMGHPPGLPPGRAPALKGDQRLAALLPTAERMAMRGPPPGAPFDHPKT